MKAWATRSASDFPAGKAVKLRAIQNIINQFWILDLRFEIEPNYKGTGPRGF